MQRRSFIRHTALYAVAVSASGYIRFDGNRYVGDCETTTDILGPFYRPGSPVEADISIAGEGDIIEVSGTVTHNDCKTPYQNAKVEIWHCDRKGVYDNSSPEYRYRGTVHTDDKGRYSFFTNMPVPYDTGAMVRPAHYHMMITATGYQPFVTQLYFAGDEHIKKDPYASTDAAKRRILEIKSAGEGRKKVIFDVGMSPKLAADEAVLERLAGLYFAETGLFSSFLVARKGSHLIMTKTNTLAQSEYEYAGNNVFISCGNEDEGNATLLFRINADRSINLVYSKFNLSDPKEELHLVKKMHTA
jgi:catechol 1,2-dioxygenase